MTARRARRLAMVATVVYVVVVAVLYTDGATAAVVLAASFALVARVAAQHARRTDKASIDRHQRALVAVARSTGPPPGRVVGITFGPEAIAEIRRLQELGDRVSLHQAQQLILDELDNPTPKGGAR